MSSESGEWKGDWKGGDSDMSDLPRLSQDQITAARKRDVEIRGEHFKLGVDFPTHSQPANPEEFVNADKANRKRLLYRSKQRGWLEVDILLGTFASLNVDKMNDEEMRQYEDILNQETVDIFNFITGKDEIPEEINTPMMKTLQDWCLTNPVGKASTQGYADAKSKHGLL